MVVGLRNADASELQEETSGQGPHVFKLAFLTCFRVQGLGLLEVAVIFVFGISRARVGLRLSSLLALSSDRRLALICLVSQVEDAVTIATKLRV